MYAPCFAVQVTKLAVLWDDLCGIDLGMVSEYVLPPFLIVNFLQVNVNEFLVLYTS